MRSVAIGRMLFGSALVMACGGGDPGDLEPGQALEPSTEGPSQISPALASPNALKAVGDRGMPGISPKVAGQRETLSSTYYAFGIGSGLGSADYTKARAPSGYYGTEPAFPPNSFTEATYSARLAQTPENLWVSNGAWLQSAGGMLDNEQTEVHYLWQHNDSYSYHVDVDYEVSSEANWDYLWINSSASDSSCNSPGVVRKKVSGQQSGTVSFDIWAGCSTMWLGIYYIKDGSVSANGDYARVKNVRIFANIPVSNH